MTAPLAELLASLEAATEGSPELDGQVLCAVRGWRFIRAIDEGESLIIECAPANNSGYVGFGANRPTRSLDAALTLKPDGLMVSMTAWLGQAAVSLRSGSITDKDTKEWAGSSRTLPLALTIAALKARAAGEPQR